MKLNFNCFIIALISIIVIFYSCEKIQYHKDDPIVFTGREEMSLLSDNDTLRDNSLELCKTALARGYSVEVDIQISKDRTIWLSHSDKVSNCSGEQNCFAETNDSEIAQISFCNNVNMKYARLEDVMKYMNDNNIRRNISIDLKGWIPCGVGGIDIEGLMRAEVDEVIRLANYYNLTSHIIFETEVVSVLKYAKRKSNLIRTYYSTYGEYERGIVTALKNDFDGLSYEANFGDELDEEKMNLLHKKGLRVMCWNIPDSTFAANLKRIKVDILQQDL
jgi:glycerophosphoryl diester phosphodiesterase